MNGLRLYGTAVAIAGLCTLLVNLENIRREGLREVCRRWPVFLWACFIAPYYPPAILCRRAIRRAQIMLAKREAVN
jgi:hypothetical protein